MTETPRIPALTRNGYTRTAAVEAEIRNAWGLQGRELVDAFREPDDLHAEALAFFIRRELAHGDGRTAEALFALLVARAQRAMRAMTRGIDEDGRADIQGEVLADLAAMLLAEDDRGDFLQSRFWLYLRRRATSARADWIKARRAMVLAADLGGEDDADDGPGAIVDGNLSPEDRAVLLDALERLPQELRELVILRHYEGWRVGDEPAERRDGADPTLSERYGITPRGVRKRLARAEALLTQTRKEER